MFDGLTHPAFAPIEKGSQLHSATNGIADAGAATAILKHVGGFTAAVVGDIVRITAGTLCTPGWYWITTVTSADQVTLDRNYTSGDTTNVTFVTYHSFTLLSAEGIKTRTTDGAPTDASVELDMDGWIIIDAANSDLYFRANGVWTSIKTILGTPVTSVSGTGAIASTGGTTPTISIATANTTTTGALTSTDWNTFNNKGSGTVTTVNGTAPIASSGGTTPEISIATANTTTTGALTSTDWNTFNGKGSGTVTGVTGASPISSTGGTAPEISIATANTTTTGALTSTDWNTFNGKQAAGSYLTSSDIDDTPVDGETTDAISSNWAFDHAALADTTSVSGHVEAATAAETTTGTDAARAVTPDSLAGSVYGQRVCEIKLIDDATAIAASAGNFSFCIPAALNGYDLVGAQAFVTTQSTSGTPTFNVINVTDGHVMLSTAITIDANNNELTSYTAATAPVIDTNEDDVVTGDILKIYKTVAGTGEKGDGVILTFQMP